MNSFQEAQQDAAKKNVAISQFLAANPETMHYVLGYGSALSMQQAQAVFGQLVFVPYENTTYPKGAVPYNPSVEPPRFAVLLIPQDMLTAWEGGTVEQKKEAAQVALTNLPDKNINYLETLLTEFETIFV
jgi:hypothetical protein